MEEYEKLIQENRKRTGSWDDEIPKINDASFVCMLDGKFMYSDGHVYTYDEVIEILNGIIYRENMEYWKEMDDMDLFDYDTFRIIY